MPETSSTPDSWPIFSLNENPAMKVAAWNWPDVRLVLVLFVGSLALTGLFHELHFGWMGEDSLARAVHLAGLVTCLAGAPIVFLHFWLSYRRQVIVPGLMKPVIWWRAALATVIAIAVPFMPAYWSIDPSELRRFPTDVLALGNFVGVSGALFMGWFSTALIVAIMKYRARLWII